MRFADVIRTALGSLFLHKLRNTLTLFGVIIGTFVLVLSLSVGMGVHELVMGEFRKHDHLRKISVNPAYQAEEADVPPNELQVQGAMSDEKRERIRGALLRRWSGFNIRKPRVALTPDRLQALSRIEHVQSVMPFVQRNARVMLGKDEQEAWTVGATLQNKNLRDRLVAGEYFPSEDCRSVLVSEFLLYRLGVRDDDQVAKVLGKKIRLEPRQFGQPSGMMLLQLFNGSRSDASPEESRVLQKAVQQLPDALQKFDLSDEERTVLRKALQKKPAESDAAKEPSISEELTIVGVFREMTKDDRSTDWGMERFGPDGEVILPVKTAEALVFRSQFTADHGLDGATVTVDDERNLKEVTRQIEEMGLHQFSLMEIADSARRNILLLSIFTGFIAFVALLVASLGITNTMLMSILERTHEIGVMKAIGARDRHIQLMFLVEGGLIGMLGGLLGLLASWIASFPGDSFARKIIEEQTRGTMEGSVFAFPLLLTVGVPFFACLVTTLAAVYPARRAARVNPITALRHE